MSAFKGNEGRSEALIDSETIAAYGARLLELRKGEILFEQGTHAVDFFMVHTGCVKMANYNDEGREFVQGYFIAGQSFGEPPFFTGGPYPASAMAVNDSSVWRCPREPFMQLLRDNFEVHLRVTQVLSGRLIYKSMMLAEIAVQEAEHRVRALIEYFREIAGVPRDAEYRVPFTRQQLADMAGLRVETVIRCIKGMERRGALQIEKGDVIWLSLRAEA